MKSEVGWERQRREGRRESMQAGVTALTLPGALGKESAFPFSRRGEGLTVRDVLPGSAT